MGSRLTRSLVRICVVVALLCGLAGQAGASAAMTPSGGVDRSAIDSYVKSEMAATGVRGVAVVVVVGDQIAYGQGFGQADDAGRLVSPQTPFLLGSLSKSFTALAVMQLVDAGLIDLDSPVQRYIPWFRLADERAAAMITIRHLLNHTSGLSRQTGDSIEQFARGPNATELNVRALAQAPLASEPGTAYAYSNANYEVLGLVIEAVARVSYADYVREHIFGPLNMVHSHTDRTAAISDGLAVGQRGSLVGINVSAIDRPYLPGALPSGYLVSSAEDMGHYLIAQLNFGRYLDRSLVSITGLREMHTPPARIDTTYAMGWGRAEIAGHRALGHSGTVPDFTTSVALLPDQGVGVIALTTLHGNEATPRLAALADNIAGLQVGRALIIPGPNGQNLTALALIGAVMAWQICSVLAGLRLYRRPTSRPVLAIALLGAAAADATLVAAVLTGVPALVEAGWAITFTYQPDLVIPLMLLVALSVVWAPIRTWLIANRLFEVGSVRRHAGAPLPAGRTSVA